MLIDRTDHRGLDHFISNICHLDRLSRGLPGILNVGTSSRGRLLFLDMNEKSYVSCEGGKFTIHECEKVCDDIRVAGLYPIMDLIFEHKRPYPAMSRFLKNRGFEVLINATMAAPNTTGFIIGDKFRIIYN